MAILTCERCGIQTAKISPCSYCDKKCCVSCIKSSKKPSPPRKLHICKSCWSSMGKRNKYKHA